MPVEQVEPVCKKPALSSSIQSSSPTKRTLSTECVNDNLVLKIKKLHPDAKIPIRGSPLAASYDIFSNEEFTIAPKGKYLFSTGISMAIPSGHYGRVAPRSGLATKHFIDVGAGVIDEDYRGEVKVLLFNFGEDGYLVGKGDRIAQLILERISTPKIEEVEELDSTIRGEGGFGSTGKN